MQNNYNRQRGGTILGIIIGLIIGLGIALAVAMAITKTPMPFTNKFGKQEKTAPTADQSTDPNKPMYGNKVKPALKEAAKDQDQAPAQAVANKDDATAESKPDAKAEVKPTTAKTVSSDSSGADKSKKTDVKVPESSDPIKDIALKGEKADAAKDVWTYYLQAGAFNSETDAEAARGKLALAGVEAHISEKPSPNGVLYRVRIGPFTQLETANRMRSKLSDNGVDVAMVRVAK